MSANKFFGNERVLSFVKNSIENKSLSHSLLVTGEKGLGKKTFARFLAKALNCEKRTFFEPCDCVSCAKIDSGNHPDVRWYGVDEEKTSVKIAEVKDLIHWISLKPFEATTKVFIVNDAHDMTLESQNAILKTLEEPPPQSEVILLTDHRNLLLETIVSRTVEINLRPLTSKEMIRILRSDYNVDEDTALFAQISGGNLGRAIGYAEGDELAEQRRLINQWLKFGSWDFFSAEGGKTREEQRELVDLLIRFLRDILVYQQVSSKEMLFFPHELARIKEISATRSSDELISLVKDLIRVRESLEDNLNQKIVSSYLATKIEEKLF
ncbi:MAG: DNA polymerase III subunit [Candidatus Omnitrophica bacterium]|nr:DNA polymerase III subunit [Candidatus Omnitrophota bacterium]